MQSMKVTSSGYDFEAAHTAMRRIVDGNILPGVSSAILVGRDLVDLHCVGWADKEAQIPLRVDHIFQVFSNTKLVTSSAALLLFEEGFFKLDDPIERYIPQLANRLVLCPGATSLDETEPAKGPITIRHLMSRQFGAELRSFRPWDTHLQGLQRTQGAQSRYDTGGADGRAGGTTAGLSSRNVVGVLRIH